MTEQEFQTEAARYLGRVARWVDRVNDDALDVTASDGIVALEFDDGTKYVLNRQSGNHQVDRSLHVNADQSVRSDTQ